MDDLESRLVFHDLVSEYCHGFDKRDFSRFLAIWWEDCIWEIGEPFGTFEAHAGIVQAVTTILWPVWKVSHHYTTNLVVAFQGRDAATGICDVNGIGTTPAEETKIIAATYADTFERRHGIWKIRKRSIRLHHFSPLPGVILAPP